MELIVKYTTMVEVMGVLIDYVSIMVFMNVLLPPSQIDRHVYLLG
jgi:hypothetical protein